MDLFSWESEVSIVYFLCWQYLLLLVFLVLFSWEVGVAAVLFLYLKYFLLFVFVILIYWEDFLFFFWIARTV